ncbi:hypothetical protein [Cellulosimicrobium phage DS1]|nr:hypothetical protein [Cellulosimicrobium phage DS1]
MTLYEVFVLIAAFIYIVSFVIYTPAKWWRSWTGRILWGTLFTKTLAVCLILSSFVLGDYAWREAIRYIAYTLILANSIIVFLGITGGMNIGRKAKQNVRTELESLARSRDTADER